MKIFIIGLPASGRTSIAKSLSEGNYCYVDAGSWLKTSFRPPQEKEHPEHYHDAYHVWLVNRMKEHPNLVVDNVTEAIHAYHDDSKIFIIDGVTSPRDFAALFDYTRDFVCFLNRTDDQETRVKDYEKIGISVIRDYCYWLAAADLLVPERWHEYNFRITNTATERFRAMGSKNRVFIIGSIDKVIAHLKESLLTLGLP